MGAAAGREGASAGRIPPYVPAYPGSGVISRGKLPSYDRPMQQRWGPLRRLGRERVRLDERAGFMLLVALTGAGMGLAAVGFRELLRGANELFFGSFHALDLTGNLLD